MQVRALVRRSVEVRVGLSSCEKQIVRAKVYKQKSSDLNDFVFTRVCLRCVFRVIVLLCFFFSRRSVVTVPLWLIFFFAFSCVRYFHHARVPLPEERS